MNDYKELIGDIGDLLIAHPSEHISKKYLQKAADAVEQLVRERDAAVYEMPHCCRTCMYGYIPCGKQCLSDSDFGKGYYIDRWEWRGVSE